MSAEDVTALVLASGVQGGSPHPLAAHDTLLVVVLIVALAVACGLMFAFLRRRSRRARPAGDEWSALAVMGELCPHGWQAQMTLYGWGAPVPADAPPARAPLVELEWTQYEEESGQIAIARRVWAQSIGEALQAMVEDRRTDVTLEQIEQDAAEHEDVHWDD